MRTAILERAGADPRGGSGNGSQGQGGSGSGGGCRDTGADPGRVHWGRSGPQLMLERTQGRIPVAAADPRAGLEHRGGCGGWGGSALVNPGQRSFPPSMRPITTSVSALLQIFLLGEGSCFSGVWVPVRSVMKADSPFVGDDKNKQDASCLGE